jgi:phosphonopyruvate decarboxylase
MICPEKLLKVFLKSGIQSFFGVPDSVLSEFTDVLEYKKKKLVSHEICANEGAAIANGIGAYLASKKIPLIYMQNSGLGNALNPLLSIAHQNVYKIPLILLIGWRGAPRQSDEVQHNVKGAVTKQLLKLSSINFIEVKANSDLKKIKPKIKNCNKNRKILAILIKNKKFIKNKNNKKQNQENPERLKCLSILLKKIKPKTKLVSTTGFTSRELDFLRSSGLKKGKDFYMVGGMGHSISIVTGFLKSIIKKQEIICIDGDGSMIMHLGSHAIIKNIKNKIKYLVFNNLTHESVGSQRTNSKNINYRKLAESFGYEKYIYAKNPSDFEKKVVMFLSSKKRTFFQAKIKPGSLKNLTRPKNLKKILNSFIQD